MKHSYYVDRRTDADTPRILLRRALDALAQPHVKHVTIRASFDSEAMEKIAGAVAKSSLTSLRVLGTLSRLDITALTEALVQNPAVTRLDVSLRKDREGDLTAVLMDRLHLTGMTHLTLNDMAMDTVQMRAVAGALLHPKTQLKTLVMRVLGVYACESHDIGTLAAGLRDNTVLEHLYSGIIYCSDEAFLEALEYNTSLVKCDPVRTDHGFSIYDLRSHKTDTPKCRLMKKLLSKRCC